ncbi:T9SS type A sorting domain-containing protein [Seonamhaeicola marinus]|uniref:T9SS type A sorting domain-containing protein n=1 Tax=Seonamhaeicola marinus TaxID=1912246 RepID=A0A5D0I4V6_9FLAO|nr:T9SS type A sorting domain-containing protein [Seonamhaeicola marinus]TYA78726.1 T9SS type A sorting domain-containing protein [Seonamhaeicola marinus]
MKKITLALTLVFINLCNAQNTYVPDDNFEQALIDLGYDSGALDDYVPTANINTLTTLNIGDKNISDLTGIEDFVSLTHLYCHSNNLNSLDLSNNTALTTVRCYSNSLNSLDVSTNTSLSRLYCNNNNLTSLDISNNLGLNQLWCHYNNLNSLDLTNNTALTIVTCDNNDLSGLDVSKNLALSQLWCYNNNLTSLDVTNNTLLTRLRCYNNTITNLDLSENTALTLLHCYSNSMTSLNVNNATSLEELFCENNELSSLDLSQNTQLTNLKCFINDITHLNLSANSSLVEVLCHNNNLSELNIKNGNNDNLSSFNANSNSSLSCIEVDNKSYMETYWANAKGPGAVYSENCGALGLEDDIWTDFRLYPNPAKTKVNIHMENRMELYSVTIYNSLGTSVFSSKDETIDITTLTPGIYFTEVKTGFGIGIKKLIIQ